MVISDVGVSGRLEALLEKKQCFPPLPLTPEDGLRAARILAEVAMLQGILGLDTGQNENGAPAPTDAPW